MIPRTRPETRYGEVIAGLTSPALETRGARSRFAAFLQKTLPTADTPFLTSSGRAALYLLFKVLPQERVYLPAYTCWVTLEAAKLAGKTVSFLDIDYPGLHVKTEEFERIRSEPGIIVATHQFGYPEDVARIREILSGNAHAIIEDCAGAIFTGIDGLPAGHLGDAAIYSFEAGKLFTLGGGAVVARDGELMRRIQEEANKWSTPRRWPGSLLRLGVKRFLAEPAFYGLLLRIYLLFRPPTEGRRFLSPTLARTYTDGFSDWQARLGLIVGTRIIDIANRRRVLFDFYNRALEDIPAIGRVRPLPGATVCPIRFPFLVDSRRKYSLYDRMRKRGVDLGFSFSYSLADEHQCPGAAKFAREVLNLPIYSEIHLPEAEWIVEQLVKCLDS